MQRLQIVLAAGCFALVGSPAAAQASPPAPKVWAVAIGAGFALTSGNTDTSLVNASYDVSYTPRERHVIKSDGLLIRGKTEDTPSADRLSLNARDEFKLSTRVYVFGQNQYLRDRFKSIDYLVSPAGGIGYQVIETPQSKLAVDAGGGGVWEKNTGFEVAGSGALTLRQKLDQVLTATTSVTQSYAGLWKTTDFEDSLQVFGLGLAAAISTRTQLKVELLDTFKNKPPLATIDKNDVAMLVAVVYRM